MKRCSGGGSEDGPPEDVTFQLVLGGISPLAAESSRQGNSLCKSRKEPGTFKELKS